MPTVRKVQIPNGKTVGEVLGITSSVTPNDAADTLQRINTLMRESVESLNDGMKRLGAEVQDERGRKIPQAVTDQDKIMFQAGQLNMALFILGATLQYRKNE